LGLYDAKDDDIVLFSDVDEIFDPKILDYFDPENYEIAYIDTLLIQRKVNLVILIFKNDELEESIPHHWVHPKITTVRLLKRFDWEFFDIRHFHNNDYWIIEHILYQNSIKTRF
jgi:hypothetical protein